MLDAGLLQQDLNTLDIGKIQHPCLLVHPEAKVEGSPPP